MSEKTSLGKVVAINRKRLQVTVLFDKLPSVFLGQAVELTRLSGFYWTEKELRERTK